MEIVSIVFIFNGWSEQFNNSKREMKLIDKA